MGCTASEQENINAIYVPPPSSQRLIIPTGQTSFDDLSSYEGVDEVSGYSYFDSILIYFDSINEQPQKRKHFYSLLGNKMGQLYTKTLEKMQDKLIKKQIGTDDLKVAFSKTIILQILNMVNKLQERPNWKSQRVQIFKRIANCQKKIIEFLWYKYPRNKKDFIPTELQEVFYSVDDSEHTDYDLLINSGIKFDYERIQAYERKEVVLQLKKLINAFILQTNRFFEHFREVMQKIFQPLEGTFKIGRKISENVNIYKDLDSDNMEIHSPEVFRVIIKFIKYTDEVFINSLEVLKKKKYFKILEKDDDEYTYFPLYTGKNPLISMLISALQPGSKQYQKQQEEQQVALANFTDNLAKILTKKTHIPQINQNQIKTIKYAKNISKFVEFLAIQKLIYLITELVHLREKMDKKNRKAIDLISCNINDLLRCQFMGSKKAILEVFSEMKQLEKDGKIKIIRVKNRFATPLNDVLVNFKFVGQDDSFIICQIQLILKKTGFQGNAKFQALAKVNHVLYQLQRSIFGPLAEMSLLLTHNDTRMGYQKKIKLERTHLKSMRCPQKQILACEYDLPIPYVCSLCTEFYHINQNSFPIHRCQNCNFYVCPKCLFQFDPQLSEECYLKEIFSILKQKFMPDLDQNEDYRFFFFNKKYLKVEEIKKKEKNFFDCLEEKMVEMEEDFAFVIRFIEGKRFLNVYHLHANGELLPTFYDLLPRFERKQFKNHQFSPYDIVLFLDPSCTVQLKNSKEVSLITVPLTDIEVNMKLCPEIYFFKSQNNFWTIDIGDQQRDNQSNSLPASNPDRSEQIQKIIQGYKPRDGQLLLDYLDIIELNFGGFQFENLRFAKLKSNRIRDITPILKYETLQEIDISRNQLSDVRLNRIYPKLRILDFSENFIQNITGISDQSVPDLKQLNLANNNLTCFPILQLSKLLWLNLNQNRITNLQNIKASTIPKLRKLSITKNQIKQIPMNSQMKELLDLQAQNNQIKSLQFLFCCPKIEQVYLYKNCISEYPENLHLFYLQRLDISGNRISDIMNIESSQFPIVKEIDFSYNLIKIIPVVKFETLQTLNLQHNQIESISNLYKSQELQSLEKLNLSENKITEFCILIMQNLQHLNVSHNAITDMTTLVHSKLPSLQKLDLSHNQIKTIAAIDQPKLQKFQLQNNNLTSMQFFNTSNVPNLKYLNLSQNKIKKFISSEFPSLVELFIKRNQLVDLTEIKEEHLMVLKILDMSENKIVELPSMYLQSVEKLILERNDIMKLELFKYSQLPCLTHLDLRFNKIRAFPTMNLSKLLVLELDSNEINDMLELSTSEFPVLEQLKLSNNKLQKLNVLKLPKLAILNLERNLLEEIDILEEFVTPEIMEIKLTRNVIKRICKLESNSLNLIDFSHNKIANGLQNFFSSHLPKLMTIKLSNNSIEGILPAIPNLPSLKFIDLSKNSLTDIENFLRNSNTPKLDTLKLNNNKLLTLTQIKMPRMKELDVSNNKITTMEDFCYSELPKLLRFFIQNNEIEHLPRLEFNTLILVNLDNNKIHNLDEFAKSDLPSLERLFLSRNKIIQWPKQLYLDKLQKLILSQNQLRKITGINFETTPELKQLILKKNYIEEIKQLDLPNLIVLNLDGNPIVSSQTKLKEALQINSKHGKINKKLKLIMNKKASERDNEKDGQEITKLKERTSAL